MKRLVVTLSGLVFVITLLSAGCFNPHGGAVGVCHEIQWLYAPVILIMTSCVDALARWHIVDLRESNIIPLVVLSAVVWSLLAGTVLAVVWKLLRRVRS